MHEYQAKVNAAWEADGLPTFHLGIGISTGDVAAAMLGSEERLEYTLVGDTVNLSARLQQWAEGGQIVLSEPTYKALGTPVEVKTLDPALVKGRETPVNAYLVTSIGGN
jgi:class 3 adenylate cyclase